ncbi:MAG TPA: chorismate synthase, partial [Acidimicrobiales bacterium]|nr:chorismate synthase [Acidimicrobiales bacterium]
MLRFLTAGESHGRALVVIVEGLPAGLPITVEEVRDELARRRLGFGRGPRMRIEQDEVTLVGGVRHGRTLGSPVAVEIANTEWPKWEQEMSPAPGRTAKALTQPRPGHADLAGMQKYGFSDARDVLERASARETAARVAAGACAKALLRRLGVEVVSHVVQMGPVRAAASRRPSPADLAEVDASPVRCFDPEAEAAMVEEVKATAKAGDSLG